MLFLTARGVPQPAPHVTAAKPSTSSKPLLWPGYHPHGIASGSWPTFTAACAVVGLRCRTARPAIAGLTDLQVPPAFWDPLEISADGDVALFKSRRAVAKVHGRICMVACAYAQHHRSEINLATAKMPVDLQGSVAQFLALCELFSARFGMQRTHRNAGTCKLSKSDLVSGRLALMAVCSLCQEGFGDWAAWNMMDCSLGSLEA
mmetsp:Transcript_32665/g.61383  ORF Transcript_32665/g.61383 Transcript_32665/m.61383 type:complete len:204 (-) Transcript_32665:161-772(-)